MQAQPEHVEGRAEQLDGHAGRERERGLVGEHHVPLTIDEHARVRVVRVEHALHRPTNVTQLGIVDGALGVVGRVPAREQQGVALPQRHVELLGDGEDELGAGPRAPGLDEAQVTGRHAHVERQVELAAAAPDTPVAEQLTDAGPGSSRPRG